MSPSKLWSGEMIPVVDAVALKGLLWLNQVKQYLYFSRELAMMKAVGQTEPSWQKPSVSPRVKSTTSIMCSAETSLRILKGICLS